MLFCWSAADYYPADLMGLYGRDPLDLSSPPVYILTGHGGQEWTSERRGARGGWSRGVQGRHWLGTCALATCASLEDQAAASA